jgi:GNAT superfamily N-acetyltransferase
MVQIRRFEEADRPSLRALFLATRRANWLWLDGREWRLEDFDVVTENEEILVAEENKRLLGFAAIYLADDFLHSLFVEPEAQGHGIGQALLKAAQGTFRGTGSLKCLERNEQAVSFYQRNGWQIAGRGDSPDGDYLLMRYEPQRGH